MPDPINSLLASVLADSIATTVETTLTAVSRRENHTFGARQILVSLTKSPGHGCRILVVPRDVPVFVGAAHEPADEHFDLQTQETPTT